MRPEGVETFETVDPSQHADRASFPYLGRLILEQTREFGATREIGAGEALVGLPRERIRV
jgi:hypothetical protein